jgi:hypothetical protein
MYLSFSFYLPIYKYLHLNIFISIFITLFLNQSLSLFRSIFYIFILLLIFLSLSLSLSHRLVRVVNTDINEDKKSFGRNVRNRTMIYSHFQLFSQAKTESRVSQIYDARTGEQKFLGQV